MTRNILIGSRLLTQGRPSGIETLMTRVWKKSQINFKAFVDSAADSTARELKMQQREWVERVSELWVNTGTQHISYSNTESFLSDQKYQYLQAKSRTWRLQCYMLHKQGVQTTNDLLISSRIVGLEKCNLIQNWPSMFSSQNEAFETLNLRKFNFLYTNAGCQFSNK